MSESFEAIKPLLQNHEFDVDDTAVVCHAGSPLPVGVLCRSDIRAHVSGSGRPENLDREWETTRRNATGIQGLHCCCQDPASSQNGESAPLHPASGKRRSELDDLDPARAVDDGVLGLHDINCPHRNFGRGAPTGHL